MISRNILIIDAILVFGILTAIFLLVGYTQPLVIAPLSSSSNTSSLLFYVPQTDFVLIDKSSKFDSSDTIFIGENVKLESGRYFIKFFDGLRSEIRQIDVETEVVLEFKNLGDKIGVFNIGDIALNVETYDKGSLINSSVVYVGGKDE
jgi:hypothetical protein